MYSHTAPHGNLHIEGCARPSRAWMEPAQSDGGGTAHLQPTGADTRKLEMDRNWSRALPPKHLCFSGFFLSFFALRLPFSQANNSFYQRQSRIPDNPLPLPRKRAILVLFWPRGENRLPETQPRNIFLCWLSRRVRSQHVGFQLGVLCSALLAACWIQLEASLHCVFISPTLQCAGVAVNSLKMC